VVRGRAAGERVGDGDLSVAAKVNEILAGERRQRAFDLEPE
jgi:hypothetical protein